MNCLRILQLSDIHLRGDRAVNAQGVDADATLRAALAGLEDVGEIDLMVLGGDLSDDGSVSSYQRLRQLVWDFAGRHGAGGGSTPVVCVPGNHDGRPGFRAVLGSGCSVRPAPSAGSDQRPVYDCRTVDGVRIISLDSSVPGAATDLSTVNSSTGSSGHWQLTPLGVPSWSSTTPRWLRSHHSTRGSA